MNLTVTDTACHYIQKRIQAENGLAFRLSIKKTGCSGYSYAPEIIDQISLQDYSAQITPELTIYVDRQWLSLLEGVKIDYIEESKLGLKQKRLIFVNPNEATRCGCGESFHIT